MHTNRILASLLAASALLGSAGGGSVAIVRADTRLRIAIIDSGLDPLLPAARGRVAVAIGDAPANLHGSNADTTDQLGHGTAIASVVLAAAPLEAELLIYKVSGASEAANLDDIARAIVAATENGADIINLSLAAENAPRALITAVAYAEARGAIVVAAAGNAGTNTSDLPGGLPGVVRVGAMDSASSVPEFSNRNPDIVALGVDVPAMKPAALSCDMLDRIGVTSCDPATSAITVSGTSFAAAHVSGVLAHAKLLRPTLTSSEAEQLLRATARDLGDPGTDLASGGGALDAIALLTAVAQMPPAHLPTIPDTSTVPRGAFAQMLLEARNLPIAPIPVGGNAVFDAIRTPYLKPLAAGRHYGLIKGDWFQPLRVITRAEALTLVDRLLVLPTAPSTLLVPQDVVLEEQQRLLARCLDAGLCERWDNAALNAPLTRTESAALLERVQRYAPGAAPFLF